MAKKPKKKLTPYNRHVQREMKAGRSMKQAAASWSKKSGKPKAKAKGSSRSSKPKGGNRTVAKKNGFNTQKIFKYVRIGALALPAVAIALQPTSTAKKIEDATRAYFGYNTFTKKMELGGLIQGWGPFVGAMLTTYGIPKLAGILRSF